MHFMARTLVDWSGDSPGRVNDVWRLSRCAYSGAYSNACYDDDSSRISDAAHHCHANAFNAASDSGNKLSCDIWPGYCNCFVL